MMSEETKLMSEETKLMSEETKSKKKWPTTKDFVYWQIFSVVLIVYLLVKGIPNPNVLSDKLTLGAAIFSILLAVVAIIIPFIQSNETSRQSFQMLSEVSKLTAEFSKLTRDIATLKAIKEDVSQDIERVISKVLETPQPEQAPQNSDDLRQQYEEMLRAMNDLKTRLSQAAPVYSDMVGSLKVVPAKKSELNKYWTKINNDIVYRNSNDN